MNKLKQNPVFSALVVLFILLFIGGIAMFFVLKGQVDKEKKAVKSAASQLNMALSLSPAPTQANLEAAEKNVDLLTKALDARVKSTLGAKPNLLKATAPTSGTQMLFQLRAYSKEFAQVASRTVPINVSQAEIEKLEASGKPLPSTTIPADFAFGFSRYIDSGEPPADDDVAQVNQQKEILTYILRKLFNTSPVGIVSVSRSPAEIEALMAPKPTSGRISANSGPSMKADEFRIGTESAKVDGAVETLPFKIVFTGITENLRSFLKQIEEFEIPLVVRSVEVVPVGDNVTKTASTAAKNDPMSIFGAFGVTEDKPEDKPAVDREPIVEDNVSEFTVVLEYITVKLTDKSATSADALNGEEEL
ncbi:Amuc_1100 family pilus-like protein [Cerasicoccus maritimus]|uniref:Amuc_1100 family pilus-like protein n=1 Tax=Cerasicoccus maritimus TaxID=490089 RepID=UPI00285269A2|nr:Amuc_1100 family pilus-like protein [Cerasicoccus maritimus]